jgi:hypothetical protein
MRRVAVGGPWLKPHFVSRGPGLPEPAVRAEEVLAEARAFAAARRATLENARLRRVTTRGSGHAPPCCPSALNSVGRCRCSALLRARRTHGRETLTCSLTAGIAITSLKRHIQVDGGGRHGLGDSRDRGPR